MHGLPQAVLDLCAFELSDSQTLIQILQTPKPPSAQCTPVSLVG